MTMDFQTLKVPKAVRDAVIAEYRQGASMDKLVPRHSLGKSTVSNILHAAGVVRQKRKWWARLGLEAELLGAVYVGAPWSEICRIAGVGDDSVRRYLRGHGIEVRRAIQWKRGGRAAAVAADYTDGMALTDIAKKHGLRDVSRIYPILESAGCKPDRSGARRRHFTSTRDKWLFKNYRIRETDYSRMVEAQGAKCAICGREESRGSKDGKPFFFAVDHDHASGCVRGLLCGGCNAGIGIFGDDPERLERAAAYLRSGGVGHG